MDGGAAATSSGVGTSVGTSAPGSPSTESADGLTDTTDLPIPVAPYALVGRRRQCFYLGYEDCRR